MANVVVIQSVFILLATLQQQTTAGPQSGLILLSCLDAPYQKSTASCLVQGRPPIRRYDYTYTLGIGGHKVHAEVATWNTARKICEQEGGYLAIINSVAESEVIAQLFRASLPHLGSSDSNYVLVGFHDLYHEGEYVTVHGEPLESVGFNEWEGSGPDNADNDENCGSMFVSGKLNDISCKKFCGFVCELPYVGQA